MDSEKFKAYLAAEVGEKAADLITVARGSQGERTDLETSPHGEGKSAGHAKQERLRAILRAPEVIQQLYCDDRISRGDP